MSAFLKMFLEIEKCSCEILILMHHSERMKTPFLDSQNSPADLFQDHEENHFSFYRIR